MVNYSKNTADLDAVLGALAHLHRRHIIELLSLQPMTISLLAAEIKLSLPAIHKHIKILEASKLITRQKIGRSSFLALSPEGLHALREWVNRFHSYWGSGAASLENYAPYIHRNQSSP